MALVYLGLGSNLGNPMLNVLAGWKRLAGLPRTTLERLSGPYRTSPVDMESPHWFINAVGSLETSLAPHMLHEELIGIEREFGRDREASRDRSLDLDILFYDDLILESPDLRIPHPRIADRLFVLLPLREIAPDHVHPVLDKTVTAMVADHGDASQQIHRRCWPDEGDLAPLNACGVE